MVSLPFETQKEWEGKNHSCGRLEKGQSPQLFFLCLSTSHPAGVKCFWYPSQLLKCWPKCFLSYPRLTVILLRQGVLSMCVLEAGALALLLDTDNDQDKPEPRITFYEGHLPLYPGVMGCFLMKVSGDSILLCQWRERGMKWSQESLPQGLSVHVQEFLGIKEWLCQELRLRGRASITPKASWQLS